MRPGPASGGPRRALGATGAGVGRSAARVGRTAAGPAARDVWYSSHVPRTSEDTAELLRRVPVFSTLGEEELARVAEVAVPRRFEPGEVVFREGDESDTCYVVRSGHARAIREHSDGRSITLATFGPGDIFGELAMFDDERRSATVEAIEQTEAIAILGGDMRRLLREHPDIAVKLIVALGRRLRETNERLARQSFQTVQSRVAAVLAQLVAAAQSEGAARGRRADHLDAGRPGAAGRVLARVGEPLPRRARAGRDHHPGPGQADRPRPRRARALRLLRWSSRPAVSSCATAR